jgi:glycosyltransferase involved in cell wall biosynthesis
MRILYHHRTLADGAEGVHIQEMVEAFEALGHQVSVHALAHARARGEGSTSALARLKTHLPQLLFELAAIAFNGPELFIVRRAIRRHRAEFVYARHALFDFAPALAARTLGVPVVLEVNASYSSPVYQALEQIRLRRLARICEGVSVRLATLVVAVSTPLRDILLAVTPGATHVIAIPNGANPVRFRPAAGGVAELRRTLAPDAALVVGWCGILRRWHGLELLIDAAGRTPELHVVIIGDGPDRGRVEGLVRERGLFDRTVFTGRVPHDRMPDYLGTLDIAVAADDRTGFASPMKVLEYMAAGCAVVAPRLPGVQDIVDDGVDGLLFTPGDAASLAAALGRLARDAHLRERLGRGARLKIERERNWRQIAATILRRAVSEPQ